MTREEQISATAPGGSLATPPAHPGAPSGRRQRPNVLPMILEIAIDAGVPTGCYWLSMTYLSHSEVVALIVASIFPVLKSSYGLLRKRALDPVSIAILFGLAFGVAMLFAGGGPKLLLVRESLFTGAFGLLCLVSLLFRSRRPLMFFFGRFFAAGSDPGKRAWYDQLWQYPGFRRVQRVITLVWGLVFVGEFTLRVVLIYTVSPATVLAVSPVALGTASLLTMLWTFSYAARSRNAHAASARIDTPMQDL
ncbi:MAG: VC0807 family protein [Steroidobacteraceae bacterium]